MIPFFVFRNLVTTAGFCLLTCAVAVFYPNVSSVLSILGGACSVSICYTVPLYAWIKLSDKHWTAKENLFPLIFFGILIAIGYLSVISTIYMLSLGKSYIGDRPDILTKQ